MLKRSLTLVSTLVICATCAVAGPEKAPIFHITTLDGKTFTNQSLKGKVVVLDFWATWCGPCRQVSKMMQSLQTKYGKQGVQIVCVDVKEPSPSKDAVIKYKATHAYTYPFSVENGQLDKGMGVNTLPTVFIIDKAGDIQYRNVGLKAGLLNELDGAVSKALRN
jgi:thiol-disulfide isomerase/thioredoxin